ncbi:MAG: hypothetical protein M1118_15035, partial [Chloroflexi bacterium]|nr:hypothetical protein [Chloroflexota bacterium]
MMRSPHQSTGGALSSQHAPPLDLPFRFFATALVGFLTLAVLSPVETEQALHSFTDPHLVALVHLQTLGIIVTTIFGATYQLLPVVLQVPLASVRLARLTWWLLVPGVAAFLTGLLGGWLPA